MAKNGNKALFPACYSLLQLVIIDDKENKNETAINRYRHRIQRK